MPISGTGSSKGACRSVPMDRRLVLSELLSASELDWLNAYHACVRDIIGPELGPLDRAWLDAATAPIG